MKIRIKNLSKKFGRHEVLTGLTMTLEENIYGILGENGAGKTTLLRCIVDLYNPTKGFVAFLNSSMQPISLSGTQIGYLPQKFGIFRNFKVQDFMEYFCNLKEIPKSDRAESIDECLKLVNLEDKRRVRVDKLSGGMVRRLGIAQALLGNPKVILFDEPTAGLDPEERARFKSIIAKIKSDKIILISTHIVEDVESICNQLIIMSKGEIKKQCSPMAMTESVKNKIYFVEKLEDISGKFEVIRTVESDGKIKNRVLCEQPQEWEPMEETLEDAYFAVMKGYC